MGLTNVKKTYKPVLHGVGCPSHTTPPPGGGLKRPGASSQTPPTPHGHSRLRRAAMRRSMKAYIEAILNGVDVVTLDVLFYAGLVEAILHFSVPLAWYLYLRLWYPRTWNLKLDQGYTPKIAIVIPTYNEIRLIRDKLNNLLQQNYPHDKLHLIVIDSASTDGTPEAVQSWIQEHPHINATLLREPVRRGMVPALNSALKHVPDDAEVVIFTDVDSFWTPDTLRNITKYFADPTVGAVTASIQPYEDDLSPERTYRDSYNIVRVAESKIHSTPIHNGALIAFRKQFLDRIGGLPTYTGNNDSTPATLIAFSGH